MKKRIGLRLFLDYLENNDLDTDETLQYHYLNEWFATILTW
jgi:glutathione-regulated potassium-efflux system ancillary protein KefG